MIIYLVVSLPIGIHWEANMFHIIVNPQSSTGRGKSKWEKIEQHFVKILARKFHRENLRGTDLNRRRMHARHTGRRRDDERSRKRHSGF